MNIIKIIFAIIMAIFLSIAYIMLQVISETKL